VTNFQLFLIRFCGKKMEAKKELKRKLVGFH
jgi:hypothetical protein